MTAVEELQDTTSGFGWPASLKVYRRGEHVFFEVQAVVELLGVGKNISKLQLVQKKGQWMLLLTNLKSHHHSH